MEYIFECSTRYLTSGRSGRVRYKVEHEKRYSISTNNQVLFCLLYRHTDNDFFDDFSKISYHFPEISEESPNIIRRLQERVRTISENNRRLPKTFEEDPKIFRSYNNKFKYSLRVKHNISEVIDIFASDCGFICRTCVALNSEFILSGMLASGKCFKVFNMADENAEQRRTNFAKNCPPMEREGEG